MSAIEYTNAMRAARMQLLVDVAGTNPKLVYRDGTKPATVGGTGGAVLATITMTGALGSVAGGVLTLNSTFTQTAANFVTGTPTYVEIATAADVVVAQLPFSATAGFAKFSGTIATGVPMSIASPATITDGNAAA